MMNLMEDTSDIFDKFSNGNALKSVSLMRMYRVVLRYVAPFMVIIVFLNAIGILKL